MKKKTKIAILATAVAITSLMMPTHHPEPVSSPVSPQIAPVSEIVVECKETTPPAETEPIVAEVIEQISTQTEGIIKSTTVEPTQPQPTEKEEPTNTPAPPTQLPTKPTSPTPAEPTPKNGDTHIVDGQTTRLPVRLRLGGLYG